MTIMIVDDSKIMRSTVKTVFLEMGHAAPMFNFVEAKDGEEALELLEAHVIDLILLDWNMPKLSGIDFLKQVRNMERYKELPIIMVTSEAAKFRCSPSPCGTWPRRENISSWEMGGFDTNLGEKDIKGALSMIMEIVTGPLAA